MRYGTILTVLIFVISWQSALAQIAPCPTDRPIVYIQKNVNDTPMAIIAAVSTPNVVVLMAPDVDIDFSEVTSPIGADAPLIVFSQCVTLASYQPTTPLPLPASGPPVGAEHNPSRVRGVRRIASARFCDTAPTPTAAKTGRAVPLLSRRAAGLPRSPMVTVPRFWGSGFSVPILPTTTPRRKGSASAAALRLKLPIWK
jgi:hypothetical protein